MSTKVIRLFLIFSSIFASDLHAQQNWPPVYKIASDTIREIKLDSSYWQILPDKAGEYTIKKVTSKPLSDEFRFISPFNEAAINPVNTYWFRFRIRNILPFQVHYSFSTSANKADFYISDSTNHFTTLKTGWDYLYSEKDGLKKGNDVQFTLLPGQQMTVYYRRYGRVKGLSQEISMTLVNTYFSLENELKDYEENYFSGEFFIGPFFMGMFILAAIFNFFFFLVGKERVYLYFSLFTLLFSLSDSRYLAEVLFKTNKPINLLLYYSIHLSFFFLAHFVRHYFKTKTVLPKWDKFLLIITTMLLLNFILSFIPIDLIIDEDIIFAAILLVNLLALSITVLLVMKKMKKIDTFFMIAISPFLLCLTTLLLVLVSATLMDNNQIINAESIQEWTEKWGDLVVYVSLMWAVIVFSWALFSRFDKQRKEISRQAIEKERMAKQIEIERMEIISKQKEVLEKQVEERTAELQHSLKTLKNTQAQLIQSEKMASLGELTAGIAHEIQNPLNFVNNFTEVNTELISELQDLAINGEKNEVIAIARQIQENESIINQHGKRADNIVKNMLQHARSPGSRKEKVNLNKLMEEYVKLFLQSTRVKNISFQSSIELSLNEKTGLVDVIPQELGRVILNLLNNAYYAVNERVQKEESSYIPKITLSTLILPGAVEIRISDNGTGINEKLQDKIFQPFFTTKPTGMGTGLGLSLSYDIITKLHGGNIICQSREGEGTEFIIRLPVED